VSATAVFCCVADAAFDSSVGSNFWPSKSPGNCGVTIPTGVRVMCAARRSVISSAHSLAEVCGKAPDEIVGTKCGGEGGECVADIPVCRSFRKCGIGKLDETETEIFLRQPNSQGRQ
jgi:hypothetical protein